MSTLWIVELNATPAWDAIAHVAADAGVQVVRWAEGDPIPLPEHNQNAIFLGSLTSAPKMGPFTIGRIDRLDMRYWHGRNRPDLMFNREVRYGTVCNPPEIPPEWCADTVFVRPTSCLKPFAGRVLTREQLAKPAAMDFGFYFDNPDEPIAISPERVVGREWRFVAINGELVADSGYTATDRKGTFHGFRPTEVTLAAQEALKHAPEPTVVIDIAETPAGTPPTPRLVEYNLFSGADLYDCNPHFVTQALMRAYPGD